MQGEKWQLELGEVASSPRTHPPACIALIRGPRNRVLPRSPFAPYRQASKLEQPASQPASDWNGMEREGRVSLARRNGDGRGLAWTWISLNRMILDNCLLLGSDCGVTGY